MLKPARHRVLLAQRADISAYPPVLHQARILDKLADVSILDTGEETGPDANPVHPGMRHVRVPVSRSHSLPGRLLGRLEAAIAFRTALRRELNAGVEVAIAFEPDAASLLLAYERSSASFKRVVHLHENIDIAGYAESWQSARAVRKTLELLDRADLIVVADHGRAEYLANLRPTRAPVLVAMNCPPLVREIPQSRLLPLLRSRGHDTENVVHYQGSVGPDHGLETLIASMEYWPADAVLVIVGHGSPQYVSHLSAIAAAAGVLPRILFTGRVPYADVLSFAAGASVGVTLLDTSRSNWLLAAGASNKRFEYAALGIPQVTNLGPGMSRLFEQPGIAVLVNPQSPAEAGEAIAAYLSDRTMANAAGTTARALHMSEYNYEFQFQPVLDELRLS